MRYCHWHFHFRFVCYEILTVVNLVVQVIITETVLEGRFFDLVFRNGQVSP